MFPDHFSKVSRGYAASRPTYPDELFALVAKHAPAHDCAWDCATGNGQAALGLARHFARVEATDASPEQIESAIEALNVRYSVQPAEATSFPPASFDAVCVAQALHWFHLDRFYAEARRVLRPRGILLVAGYTWTHVSPEFDAVLKHVVLDPLRALWPRQSAILAAGYSDIAFPFERIELPALAIEMEWSLEQFLAYIATWTGLRKRLESDPRFLERAAPELAASWGGRASRKVSMPLHVVCGRRK